ncbi:hypothetical protein PRIPAC_89305 [Pristionchus pacificus]|uniref:Uncharacterized protein n=1 Tax=Pristionchus pacificus TaxID=54126 RepID=A0A2A6CUU8_PRIPA|nr:hypothetical protein PRIPAC_89305 [Pristionchus pacificus]|eukprot:PDM82002.1 hypothetical protein PRIPAC_36395 [Pristionchus pacificus]
MPSSPIAKRQRVDEFRITELPSDIIRMIIDMDQKSIDMMRLISHHWNNVVHEYFNTSNRLPVIKKFKWKVERVTSNVWRAHLRISKCDEQYFGIDQWHLQSVFSTSEETIFEKFSTEYGHGLKEEWLKKRFGRLFIRCSRIERLEIGLQLDLMEQVMDGKIVDELTIFDYLPDTSTTNDLIEFSEKILNFVRDHSVKNLVLHMGLRNWIMEMESSLTLKDGIHFSVSVNQFSNEHEMLAAWKAHINSVLIVNEKSYSAKVENHRANYQSNPIICVLVERIETYHQIVRDRSVKGLVLHMGLGKWRKEMKFFAAFFNEEAPLLSKIEFNLTVSVNQSYNERQLLEEWKALINGLLNNKIYSVTFENKEKYGGYHIFPRVDELRVSELPSDIIRRVIDMDKSSIDNMRLISRHWDSVVHEYLSTSSRLPVIKKLRWNMEIQCEYWRAYLEVSHSDKRYFGVENWTEYESSKCTTDVFNSYSPLFVFGVENVANNWLIKRLERLFYRCSRVVRMEMEIKRREFDKALNAQFEVMGRAMGRNIVDKLVLFTYESDGSPEDLVGASERILKFVQDHSVKSLILKMGLRNWIEEAEFFSSFFNEAAPLLSKIKFKFSVSVNQFYNKAEFLEEWQAHMNSLLNPEIYSVTVKNKNKYGGYPQMRVVVNRRNS